MQQSACLVFNPIMVHNFAVLFKLTPVDRASNSMIATPKAISFSRLGLELFRLLPGHRSSADDRLLPQISSGVVWRSIDLQPSCNTFYLLSPRI